MGSEKQIIQVLTGKEIPAGGRPADIGVLVHNVATAFAVQQAVRYGRPLMSRIVTVSGGAIKTPCNVEALIGTPVQELIDFADGYTQPAARLVLGGPMMGQQFTNTEVPVVKGTSGVLALTQSEIGQSEASPCIRCSTCVRACPVGLVPLEMVTRIRASDLASAVKLGLKDCIACGSCSYVCPGAYPAGALLQLRQRRSRHAGARQAETGSHQKTGGCPQRTHCPHRTRTRRSGSETQSGARSERTRRKEAAAKLQRRLYEHDCSSSSPEAQDGEREQ